MESQPKKIAFTSQAQRDIQAYIDYTNIVGADDNGKLMSEAEFEEYKKKVSEKRKNRLYTFWINSKNFECKSIGPESMCFCNHRYKYHDFDSVIDKKVKCKKCSCKLFSYVPVYGANDVKCLCHHSYREHDFSLKERKCKRNKCKCLSFQSKFTCNCGEGYDTHKTVIYTKDERIKMGKNVDVGWFGESLMNGAGALQNFGGMMNDVYDTEFKNLEKKVGEKKIMYKDGKPVNEDFNNNNNMNVNVNNNNVNNNFGSNNNGGTNYYSKEYKNFSQQQNK
jgi:hypothetical protein